MNSARWFQRREDYAPKRTRDESPFRCFVVHCLKCDCHLLKVGSEFDEESGETRLTLRCTKCGQIEKIAVV